MVQVVITLVTGTCLRVPGLDGWLSFLSLLTLGAGVVTKQLGSNDP